MPIDPATAVAAAQGVGAVTSNIFNNASQWYQNSKNRKWSEKMYTQQKNDNLDFWNKQNEYNDPANQMKRLQAAGLNPNLVYGNGSAVNTASPISKADMQKPDTQALRVERTGWMDKIYDYQIKKQTVDNLKAQNTVLLEDAAYKAALTKNVEAGTDTRIFDLGFKGDTRDISLQGMQEKLRQTQIGNQFQLDENERRTLQNAQSLQEGVQRIANMKIDAMAKKQGIKESSQRVQESKARINNYLKDGKIKDFEIKLNERGVTKGDAIYYRFADKILDKVMNDTKATTPLKGGLNTIGNYLFNKYKNK